MNKNKGLTIIEILIALSITAIMSAVVLLNLSSFRSEQVLKNTTSDIISTLNKARQKTLSSVNSNNYGVHFDSNKIVLFTGSVYDQNDSSNEIIEFDKIVNIPNVGGLNIGGGSDVVFERLTGDTIGGTITVELISNPEKQKTIFLNKTGTISLN